MPGHPPFVLFCLLLGPGALIFLGEQDIESSLGAVWLLSWALVLAYAVPVAFLIYRLDLFEREPLGMLAGAVVWGGVVAASLAGLANEAWLSVLGKAASPEFASQWGSAIVAPGVEETLKLMGVVVLYLIASTEFDGPMDGFVYGAMVGLGFTVVEDVSYFFIAGAAAPGAVQESGLVLDSFLIRVVASGLYGHVLFTGLTGMGFAYLVTQRAIELPRRIGGAGLCIAAGVMAHALWNSPVLESVLETSDGVDPSLVQWIAYGAFKGMPFLVLLVVLVVLATRSEERSYRAIVAGEPDPMVVTDDEMRSLGSLWARRSARSAAARLHGPLAARWVGRLQAAQIEYAMIRSRSDSLADPALDAQRLKIRSIRAMLAGTPFVPAALRPAAAFAASPAPGPAGPGATGPLKGQGAVTARRPTTRPLTGAARNRIRLVPPGGMAAWLEPDGARLPVAVLPGRTELLVESRTGPWARVRAVNGWTGWVDGRLLVRRQA